MSEKSGEVFIIEGGNIKPLPPRSFRGGVFGKNLEEALKNLIEKYPEVIPGRQIDPESDDPPRFALLCREMPVGEGSLDLLLVDQYAVLILVETKLAENREARREVIGQIIEYAANAVKFWGNGKVREEAAEFWSKHDKDVNDVIREKLGIEDEEGFWQTVEENLKEGVIRLIIAGDELYPEVQRIIEYLNREMENAEVYGLELRCFGQESEKLVLAPRLIGQTQEIADRKSKERRRQWNEESFFRDIEEKVASEEVRNAIRKIYDFSKEKADEISWGTGSVRGSFGPKFQRISQRKSVYTVWSDGTLTINFGWLNDNENALQWREKLYNRLREIMKDYITPEKKEKYPNIPPEIWVPRVEDFINIITELLEET